MFQVDQVTSVYSGRKGCACGCRGKYSYASAHRDARPSYKTGDDDISDRSVRTMVKKVQAMIQDPNFDGDVMFDADFVAVDMPHDRTYTVYFK